MTDSVLAAAFEGFWFSPNRDYGMADDREEWLKLVDEWAIYNPSRPLDTVFQARRYCPPWWRQEDIPSFSFSLEHTTNETLGQFFDKHGMSRELP